MVYNAANSQQSNTYQYPTDKKVRKLFEVPTYNQGRPNFIEQRSTAVIVHPFAGSTWINNSRRHKKLPTLFCDFYIIYVNCKYSRGPQNTNCGTAGWRPVH